MVYCFVGVLGMDVCIGRDRVIVRGISTHNLAQQLIQDLREIIEERDRVINVLFEGSPGPWGEGLCLRISISGKPLDDTALLTVRKFFELRGARVVLEGEKGGLKRGFI